MLREEGGLAKLVGLLAQPEPRLQRCGPGGAVQQRQAIEARPRGVLACACCGMHLLRHAHAQAPSLQFTVRPKHAHLLPCVCIVCSLPSSVIS